MWLPGAGWTAGNYVWKLEYIVKDETGVPYNTGASTTISMDVTPSNATDLIETIYTSVIDLDFDQTLSCHFYRDVANDNADDTGDFRFAEIYYYSDRLGQEITRGPF
jgi:hypothetical protein